MNKFYNISELKQCLVDVWQSAAERYWRDHQRMEKALFNLFIMSTM